MKEKTNSSELSHKMRNNELDNNQFDHFWEIKCPDCGSKIDLEVLVNLLKSKGGKK